MNRAPRSSAALVWSRALEWSPVLVLVRDDGKLAAFAHVGDSIWHRLLRRSGMLDRAHLAFLDRAAAKAGCFDVFREEEWILDSALLRRASPTTAR